MPKPNPCLCYDHEIIRQLVRIICKQPLERFNFYRGTLVLKAQKDNALVRILFTKHLFPKILVIRVPYFLFVILTYAKS